jgi:hypothetical protein
MKLAVIEKSLEHYTREIFFLAERERFELSVQFPVHTLSRRAP